MRKLRTQNLELKTRDVGKQYMKLRIANCELKTRDVGIGVHKTGFESSKFEVRSLQFPRMMPAMCDERERLIGYVYDECEPSERKAIEAHLEECGTCRAEIGGLRDARQDLLAWAVPPHEAVWRPLVAAPVVSWYRQVPVWAMAAAAGVMFLAGAAGGVVTHAFVHGSSTVVTPAPASVQTLPAGVTESQLSDVEQRIVQRMRDELSKRPGVPTSPIAARVVAASNAVDLASLRVNEILAASDQRQWENLRDLQNEWNRTFKALKGEVNGLKQEVVLMQQGGGR